MRAEMVERQVGAMQDAGLNAILSSSPENFGYVMGFLSPTQSIMRWRHAMALVTQDGAVALLAVDMEASTIRARAPEGMKLAVWREFSYDAMAVLAGMLRQAGLATARIGVELDYLPAGDFAELQALLPQAEFRPAQALLARLRQIKTQAEIDLLRRLSRIADEAITEAYAAVHAGMTEMDLAAALTRGVYERGAEDFRLMIIATGERSRFPNVGPTTRVLRDGDVCRMEIFPMIGGYHAGVCRTAVVGLPPPHAEAIWAKLAECKHMLLDLIGPGASTRAIYERYLDRLASLDLPAIAFVGHGIGLHLHEDPYLGGGTDQRLEAGMVLGIEPLIYETGHGYGMQNKDMVLVTASGCTLLSDYTDTDHLIRVR